MADQFVMPKLGLTMEAGTVVQWLVEGTADVNELVAKKFSLLGVMLLVTINRWRSTRAPPSLGEDGAVPGIVSLVVRLLISSLFLRVAHFELRRLLWPPPPSASRQIAY